MRRNFTEEGYFIFRFLTVIVLGSLFLKSSWSMDLKNGLVAYYPFNSDAKDYSGNGYHGSVVGATLSTDRFGNEKNSFSFNSSMDYIEFPNNVGEFSFGNGSFTVLGWFKPSSTPIHPSVCDIVMKESNVSDGAINYRLSWNGNLNDEASMRRSFYFSVESSDNYFSTYTSVNETFDETVWYQVVGVLNNTEISIYINGSLKNSSSIGIVELSTGTTPLRIGSRINQSIGCSGGDRIDDIRIYNRNLCPEEINILSLEPSFCTNFSENSEGCSYHGNCQYKDNLFETFCNCTGLYYGEKCESHPIICDPIFCSNHGNCTYDNDDERSCDCEKNYYGKQCSVTTCSSIFSNDSSVCSNGIGRCYSFENCSYCGQYVNQYFNFFDNFENSTFSKLNWEWIDIGGVITTVCTSYSGDYALEITSSGQSCPRSVSTKKFKTLYPTEVTVSFRIRSNAGQCEQADINEHVEVFIDSSYLGGGTSLLVQLPSSQNSWDPVYSSVSPPVLGDFSIRFYQGTCSGAQYDHYVLDDVTISFGEIPCSGNGTCENFNGNLSCFCDSKFSGMDCSECSKDCGSHGECVFIENFENSCSCNHNYTGLECEYIINCTHLDYCSGHGECDDYVCKCDIGYTKYPNCNESYVCDSHTNNDSLVCTNRSGICSSHDNCTCYSNYEGKYCEWSLCPERSFCNNHGRCLNLDPPPKRCFCEENYYGTNCSIQTCSNIFSNLTSQVCLGKGECVSHDKCVYCAEKNNSYSFSDNFENSTFTISNWREIGQYGILRTDCGSYDGTTALYISSPGNGYCPRKAQTKDFVVGAPAVVTISFRIITTSLSTCELADFGEEVSVYVVTDIGDLLLVKPSYDQYIWTQFTSSVIVNSGKNISVLFYQPSCTQDIDTYLIDDFSIDIVHESTCNNHGDCVDMACQCDTSTSFGGKFCDVCGLDCGKNGNCDFDYNYNKWSCKCNSSSITGPLCEFPVNCTHLDKCSLHGTCNDYFCDCEKGWDMNERCNTSYICSGKTNNDSDVCNGNGVCISEELCQCENSTTIGQYCQYLRICNERDNCSGVGYCPFDINPRICECDENYFGENCSVTTCSSIHSNESSVCGGTGVKCWPFDRCRYCGNDDSTETTNFFDNFEDSQITNVNWNSTSNHGYITSTCGSYSGSDAYMISSSSGQCPRQAVTRTFSVFGSAEISISFRLRTSTLACETADSGEEIRVYLDSKTGGSVLLTTPSLSTTRSSWNYVYSASYWVHSDFSVRFYQEKCSGTTYDNFVLDDVSISFSTTKACNGNGTCINQGEGLTESCVCDPTRFSGPDCLDCGGGCVQGTCYFTNSIDFNTACLCNSGYHGILCNLLPCGVDSGLDNCNEHGKCVVSGTGDDVTGTCECDSGWSGSSCSINDALAAGISAAAGITTVTIIVLVVVGLIVVLLCCCLLAFFILLIVFIILGLRARARKKTMTGSENDQAAEEEDIPQESSDEDTDTDVSDDEEVGPEDVELEELSSGNNNRRNIDGFNIPPPSSEQQNQESLDFVMYNHQPAQQQDGFNVQSPPPIADAPDFNQIVNSQRDYGHYGTGVPTVLDEQTANYNQMVIPNNNNFMKSVVVSIPPKEGEDGYDDHDSEEWNGSDET